jgi:hypothetical protein
LLTHRHDDRLASLVLGLQHALAQVADAVPDVQTGAGWLERIATILDVAAEQAPTSGQIAHQLEGFLAQLDRLAAWPGLAAFRQQLQKVSRSYWSGLFHCYDHTDIPRTNNGLESHFRDTQRRLLRTTGQKGRTRRTLHRLGAWELMARPPTEGACVAALCQIAPQDLADEQQRLRQHRERFRLHTRSQRQTTAQLDQLQQQWFALPGSATG